MSRNQSENKMSSPRMRTRLATYLLVIATVYALHFFRSALIAVCLALLFSAVHRPLFNLRGGLAIG